MNTRAVKRFQIIRVSIIPVATLVALRDTLRELDKDEAKPIDNFGMDRACMRGISAFGRRRACG